MSNTRVPYLTAGSQTAAHERASPRRAIAEIAPRRGPAARSLAPVPVALVIHAHPDDETFATGAWMRQLASSGWTVRNIIATGGEASELTFVDGDLKAARTRRLTKFESALALLGSDAWEWLGEEHTWLDAPARPERTVASADEAELTDHVRRAIRRHKPGILLTVGSDGLTGHPDHIAINRAVRDAVRADGVPSDGAWGARLHADDVARARGHIVKALGKGATLGSGRVDGATHALVEIDATPAAELRRQALDVYRPGLGTKPLHKIAKKATGDSAFLRAHFDASGWGVERYQAIQAETPVTSVFTQRVTWLT